MQQFAVFRRDFALFQQRLRSLNFVFGQLSFRAGGERIERRDIARIQRQDLVEQLRPGSDLSVGDFRRRKVVDRRCVFRIDRDRSFQQRQTFRRAVRVFERDCQVIERLDALRINLQRGFQQRNRRLGTIEQRQHVAQIRQGREVLRSQSLRIPQHPLCLGRLANLLQRDRQMIVRHHRIRIVP